MVTEFRGGTNITDNIPDALDLLGNCYKFGQQTGSQHHLSVSIIKRDYPIIGGDRY